MTIGRAASGGECRGASDRGLLESRPSGEGRSAHPGPCESVRTHGVPLQARHRDRRGDRGCARRRERGGPAAGAGGQGTLRPGPQPPRLVRLVRFGVAAAPAHQDPRIPGLQPGARHVAAGRTAAGAVAGHPAPAVGRPRVQGHPRRRPRPRPRRGGAVGGVRRAGGDRSGHLYRLAAGGGEERRTGRGHPPLRRLRQGGRRPSAQDALRVDLSGHPAGSVDGGRVRHRPERRARVRSLLRRVRRRAAPDDPAWSWRCRTRPGTTCCSSSWGRAWRWRGAGAG